MAKKLSIPESDDFIQSCDRRQFKNFRFKDMKAFAKKYQKELDARIEENLIVIPHPEDPKHNPPITFEQQHGKGETFIHPKYIRGFYRDLTRGGCIDPER